MSRFLSKILPDEWQTRLTCFLECKDYRHDYDDAMVLADVPSALQESLAGGIEWHLFKCSLHIGGGLDTFCSQVQARSMTLQLENRYSHPFSPLEEVGAEKCLQFSRMLDDVQEDFGEIAFPVLLPALAASDRLYMSYHIRSKFFSEEFSNNSFTELSKVYLTMNQHHIVVCIQTFQTEYSKPCGRFRNRLQVVLLPKDTGSLDMCRSLVDGDWLGEKRSKVVWSVFDTGMDKSLALAMGTHARLGQQSFLSSIDPALLYTMRKCFVSDIGRIKHLRDQVNGSLFDMLERQLLGEKGEQVHGDDFFSIIMSAFDDCNK